MDKIQTLQLTAKGEKEYSESDLELLEWITKLGLKRMIKLIQNSKVCKKQIKVKKALLKVLRTLAFEHKISLN